MENREKILILENRIKTVLRRERFILFAAGLLGVTGVLILTTILLSLFAAVVILPVWIKIAILILAGGTALYFFWRLCSSLS